MPIIIVTERDLWASLMRQIDIPTVCVNCGHVYPDKAEQVAELKRSILFAIRPFLVRHVLDGEDAPPSSQGPLQSDDQSEPQCRAGDATTSPLGFCRGDQ